MKQYRGYPFIMCANSPRVEPVKIKSHPLYYPGTKEGKYTVIFPSRKTKKNEGSIQDSKNESSNLKTLRIIN